nr:PREDICTED: LRR receptor-like serine/threonine-protein kinase GSO2 [Daucus carota subsp. sativus]XP_017226252.1 PREDICTED: LRR receptor-like serine/threonine-protein kinase GSO2 [Daucus carota subsp. sativus]
MEIQKYMSSLLLVYATCLTFCCGSIVGGHLNGSCIHSEKQALLLLRKSLHARNDSWLLPWDGDDCCSWSGVYCNNITGQVIKLDLRNCCDKGSISQSIGNLTALTQVYLSDSSIEGIIPESIGALKSLTYLDLSFNNHGGFIPQSIGNLTSLIILDLYNNQIRGLIPESIGALTSLTRLDLSLNYLHGLIPPSIGNLISLFDLYLKYNRFSGSIPAEIGNLTKLSDLTVSANRFTGSLPESLCQLNNLSALLVDDNQLGGSIPKCIGKLSNLEIMDLVSNSWDGIISEHHFVNLTNLFSFRISSRSNLMVNISSRWVPPFQLNDIYMDYIKVPKFPKWLITQRSLADITVRNTSISDTILAIPNSVRYLDLSNNHMFGNIPALLCNLTSLKTMLVSDNKFSGALPPCLGNLTDLHDFSVMNNNLGGDIPISLGFLRFLWYLNLHNNNFQGKLPLSFQNLSSIIGLDVGKNNLSDILPGWTSKLLDLRYLILRSNNFYGEIPTDICHPSIQVLNLAKNDITGNIPPCFGNFTAIITSYNSGKEEGPIYGGLSYEDIIIDDPKGYELTYSSTLDFLYSIDLSNNNISGEIPKELTNLHGLLSLNIAGNRLSGRIPDTIGKLDKLEFLDLSRNELAGHIPQSLSNLSFLSHLNLSFNDFSGRIPTGNQLRTLDDPSIYVGNNQLCGPPILKPCPGDTDSHDFHNNNEAEFYSDDEHVWFYAGIGPGLLVGFLGFCASFHFIPTWRYFYFHSVERFSDKIALSIALWWRRFQN